MHTDYNLELMRSRLKEYLIKDNASTTDRFNKIGEWLQEAYEKSVLMAV